jgi:DNA end-binding protein Ku
MASRPIWRGHLRLALVSCPIALYTVYRARGDLHFHLINPKTGNRIRMVTQDAETDEELSRSDLVRGYEFEKDRYVIMDKEDFENARVESSSVMTIDKFVNTDDIPPIYFDSSYYLAPDGEAGQDVYVVLREAIAQSGKAALSRVVISQRERPVTILPFGTGMVMHTLHEKQDLNDSKQLFDQVAREKADPEMVKLAMQLMDRQVAEFEPSDVEDHYEARLREVIAAKLRGQSVRPAAPPPQRDNVIDLMAALKQSLGRGERAEKAPARQRTKQPARSTARHPAPRKQTRKRA